MSYREDVLRTAVNNSNIDSLTFSAMGLAGETGEVVDLIKKHVYHDVPLNRDKLIEELGDVRWYFEVLCNRLNVSMEEIERLNIEKLKKRYPNGFTTQASLERKDEQ